MIDSTAASDGDALVYSSANARFEFGAVASGGGAALGSVANNTLDLSTGNFFEVTTNDQTLTFSNPPDVHEFKIKLTGDGTVSNYIINAASFDAFGVGNEETAPEGLFFKPDGSKMYIVGDTGDDVNEYDLSTPWDVSSASYLQNFSVSAQESTPTDLFFKPDGSKMYIVGSAGDDVNEYSLSSAWDISTASFSQLFSVAAQESSPTGIFFKPDGTKMYIAGTIGDDVNEYNLSTPWDVSTASFLQAFSFAAQEIVPQALFFKPDGAKMYIVGTSSDTVYQYSLSTAWDVSSASYDSVSLNVSSLDGIPKGVFFKEDGSRLYVLGASTNTVYSYSLSTVYDINSASFNSKLFSVVTQETTPVDLFFKPDGTKMYVLGATGDDVNEYDLSTAWDVSTASFLQLFSIAAEETGPQGLFFKPDGTKMYVVGTVGDDVNEYNLSTAWDVTSASFLRLFSIAAQESAPNGIFFKPDGTKMYIVGSNGDEVNEYDLSTAWDVSTASFLQGFSVAGQDAGPTGLFFKPDGSKMYIIGNGSDTVYQYSLSTAWDVSSASYDAISVYITFDTTTQGVTFDSEGSRMYVLGSGSDRVYQYDVTATTLATITYPASVKFPGATPPAAPAIGAVDTLEFYTVDGGTTFYAYQLGDAHG
jgi:sugar lactone lactonase YvrE